MFKKSTTDGLNFDKIIWKRFYVNATFIVKIPETQESKFQMMIPTVTVTLLYNIHNGRKVINIYHSRKYSVSRSKLSYACCGSHHFKLAEKI